MMKKTSASLSFLVLMLLSFYSHADIEIENFRINLAPEISKTTAAYGVIKNSGIAADTLIDISSDAAMVMLHKTEINSGMAKMIHMPNLVIEAGSELVLEPMSYHLMLSDLTEDVFKEGMHIIIIFEFEKAGKIKIDVPVKAPWD